MLLRMPAEQQDSRQSKYVPIWKRQSRSHASGFLACTEYQDNGEDTLGIICAEFLAAFIDHYENLRHAALIHQIGKNVHSICKTGIDSFLDNGTQTAA